MDDPASSISVLLYLVFILLLLMLSAVFSASETALTSASRLRLLKKDEKEGIHKVNRLLTATLVMNNFVNLLLSSIATLLLVRLFKNANSGLIALIGTIFTTTVILIFGEITPKIYAREYSEKVYGVTARIMTFFEKLLSPVIGLLLFLSNKIVKLFGGQAMEDAPFITSEDIIEAVNLGKEGGTIDHQEGMIVERTFQMNETTIKEIMTPRVDVVAVEENMSLLELMEVVNREGYSRIPVYREDIDNITGVCYAKDVVGYIQENGAQYLNEKKVKEIMREPIFVPETMRVGTLLKIFKEKKVHIAIVVDEFGGTAGIVTLEDILEELIGEIMDEYDYDEISGIKKVGENSYLINATTPINDLERELDVQFEETEHETLAGYLLELFQKIPSVGEEIDVGDFHFRVVAATKNRIERVLMTIKRSDITEQ
ncbi:MAG TPA: hemolysin family protein [Pseudothermotoga sp.]|nr:hemolysin family protein [Pseudothermotoga sp.]HOK82920.1 hemolysin family protein [Pseudothermotoga sp.]HPP69906.1 hemolysin family protein [Pseudothermotoga sp.]